MMQKDLINRAELKATLLCLRGARTFVTQTERNEHDRMIDYAINALDQAPAVDAACVVRCSKCEFAKDAGFKTITGNKAYWCRNIIRDGCTQVLDADDFCSYGMLKKDRRGR